MITIGDLKKAIKEIEENYNFGDGYIHQSVDEVPVIISIAGSDSDINPRIKNYSCEKISHDFYCCPDSKVRICLSVNNI